MICMMQNIFFKIRNVAKRHKVRLTKLPDYALMLRTAPYRRQQLPLLAEEDMESSAEDQSVHRNPAII